MRNIINILKKNFKNEIVNGIFWNFFGNILARTSNLVVSIFVAYFLTKDEYGQLGFLKSTLGTFVIFGTFGFSLSATKFYADEKYSMKLKDYGLVLRVFSSVISVFFAGLLFIFSEDISVNMGGGVELNIPLKITSISLLFLSLNSVQSGMLLGLKKFKNTAKAISISSLLAAVITVFLTKYYKLNGYALGMGIGALLNWLICFYYLKKFTIVGLHSVNNAKEIIYDILRISLPAVLSGIIVMPVTWYSNYLIINTENGLESLGSYNAVYNISAISLAIINIFSQSLLPFAIKNFNTTENKRFEMVNYYTPFLIGVFLSLPLILIPEVVFLVYKNKYSGHEIYLITILIGISTIIISQRQGIAKNFIASGKMWISFWGNLFWGAILIVSLMFLRKFGALGYALSFLVAYFFNSLVFIPLYVKLKLVNRYLIYSRDTLYIVFTILISVAISLKLDIYMRIISLLFIYLFYINYYYKKIRILL